MKWLAALMMVLAMQAAHLNEAKANEAAPLAQDPVVEQRLNSIAEELRCLVCQNESLAGSRADLAMDLRRELRNLIRQGKSDQEIREFLVTRYGDYVLYRPPVKPTTWLLWIGPFVLLLAALAGLIFFLRNRQAPGDALSPEDQRKAEALLNGEPK